MSVIRSWGSNFAVKYENWSFAFAFFAIEMSIVMSCKDEISVLHGSMARQDYYKTESVLE